jgi:hypothetical protein
MKKNDRFFYVMDLDEESRLRNVFWADARGKRMNLLEMS